jgi:hypothetical protein
MLVSVIIKLALFGTSVFASDSTSNISIKNINNERVQIDFPINLVSYHNLYVVQQLQGEFQWDNEGSKFYQCVNDNDCTEFNANDVNTGIDSIYQSAAILNVNPDTNKFVRFISPKISDLESGAIPTVWNIAIRGNEMKSFVLTNVFYKIPDELNTLYTWIPTTICQYNDCQTTNYPELKTIVSTTVNGVATTLETQKTVSYQQPVITTAHTTIVTVYEGVTTNIVTVTY